MPTLAKEIVDRNAEGINPKLNYKGFAVGNPATTPYSTTPAMVRAAAVYPPIDSEWD